jgi:hypothetical protein
MTHFPDWLPPEGAISASFWLSGRTAVAWRAKLRHSMKRSRSSNENNRKASANAVLYL